MVRVGSRRISDKLSMRAGLLSSAVGMVVVAGAAQAQTATVTRTGPGDISYSNTGTVAGTPLAIDLQTADGSITADVATVTSTGTAGNNAGIVNAKVAGDKALNVKVDSLTGTGGTDLRGIQTFAGTGLTTVTSGNLNIAGLSGIFADTRGDLVVNAGNVVVNGAAVDDGFGNTKDVHGIAAGRLEDINGNQMRVGGKATINVASVKVTGGDAATAINVDAVGDIAVTAGAIDSEGEGVNVFSEGNTTVVLNGNVNVADGAVSADGVNTSITVADGVTVRSGGGTIEAEGANGNILIDNKGSVISTGVGDDDSQGAILADGSGTITIRSKYAESNDDNERGQAFDDNGNGLPAADQRGTIMTRATTGATSITADKTVANGNAMRGIDAQATTGSITIVANETTTAGGARNVTVPPQPAVPNGATYVQNAIGIAATTTSGNISITSEKVTTTGLSNAGINATSASGNILIDSGSVTKSGLGNGVVGVSTAGTVTIVSDNVDISATTGASGGIVANAGKGVKITSGAVKVTNGTGITATSAGQTSSTGVEIVADSVAVTTGTANNNLVNAQATTSGNVLIDVGTVTGATTGTAAGSSVFGRAVNGSVRIEADNVVNSSTQSLVVGNAQPNQNLGAGINAVGRGVTIVAGNVEAQGWAIRVSTNETQGQNVTIPLNDGKVSITTTGAVNSRAANAISINGNAHSFDVLVDTNSVVTGHATSALAGGARVGDINVVNRGKIIGAEGSDGAIGVTATGGGNVTIVSNETSVASSTAVSGTFISGAIAAASQGGNGNVSVTSTKATASGASRYAIYTTAAGTGTVTIDSGTASSDAADVATISANSASGAIKVTSGTLTNSGTGSVGIRANSTGGGAIDITSGTLTNSATGATANTAEGIYATTAGAIKVTAGTTNVAGTGASAIVAMSSGSTADIKSTAVNSTGGSAVALYAVAAGNVSIDSGAITTAGLGNSGISATSNTGSVTIASQSIATTGSQSNGITATAATGVTINSGTITAPGTNAYGINATTTQGNVAVTSGAITAGRWGINAMATQGNVNLTINGDVTATAALTSPTLTSYGVRATGRDVVVTQAAGTTITSRDRGIDAQASNSSTVISAGTVTSSGLPTILANASNGKATVRANIVANTGTANAIAALGATGAEIVAETVTTAANAVATDLVRASTTTAGNATVDVGTVTGNSNFSAVYAQANNGSVSIIADNVSNSSTAPLTVNGVTNHTTGAGIIGQGRGVTIVAGNVESNGQAIRASTTIGQGANATIPLNDGKVSITTTGAVTSRNSNAISINGNAHSFDVTVEANSVVTGHATSTIAGGARVGDILVNNKGKVVAEAGSDGAIGVTATGGGNVVVNSNETVVNGTTPVAGTFISGAIAAVSQGGNGNVTVTSTKATVTGEDRYGIYASAVGTGNVSVTSGTLAASGGEFALQALADDGTITINSGTLNAGDIGIDAHSGGNVTVTSGALTTVTGEGIQASSEFGTVAVTSGTIDAHDDALIAYAGGDVTVNVNGNTRSQTEDAISLSSGKNATLTIAQGATVRGGESAVNADVEDGILSITNRGTLIAGTDQYADEPNGPVASYGSGIHATAYGTGRIAITSNAVQVTGTARPPETELLTGVLDNDAGIRAEGGAGAISIDSTSIDVAGANRYGIVATGTGAIDVKSGTLKLEAANSAGIMVVGRAADGAAAGNVTVNSGAVTSTGAGSIGISATGVGRTGVTSTSVTSAGVGILANGTTGVTVTAGNVSAGGNAIRAASTGGDATVTVTGAVTTTSGAGVSVSGVNTNVTVSSGASVRGGSVGVVLNGTTGNVLTNNGTIGTTTGAAVLGTPNATQIVNSGTITGGTAATGQSVAVALGAGNDTMTLRTGSVINGLVSMGAGTDTVILSGTVNTATTTQTLAQFAGAENLNVDTGYWTASSPVGAFTQTRIAQGAALQVNQANGSLALDPGTTVNNGRILLNLSGTHTSDGAQISGTGSLSLIGAGTLVVANGSGLTYTGGTEVGSGKLQVTGNFASNVTTSGTGIFELGNGGTTGTYTGNVVNNGTFIYNRSDSYTMAGNFSGTGSLVKNGAGTFTIGGTYAFTGTTTINAGTVKFTGQLSPTTELDVKSGTVDVSGATGGTQTIAELQGSQGGGVALGGTNLVVDQATNTSFGGSITGTGGIVKDGAGTLDLTGTNTYSGQTRVDEGTLKVNGSIANSTVVVTPGATLGGNGTVGGIQMAGGNLSPGNSIGRMTVNGNIALTAASTYTVEANAAGQADRVDATGTAALGGAKLQVLAENGTYKGITTYTILTAAGGVSGTFGSVTSNLAFLTPSVTYGSNAVTLRLSRNNVSFASFAKTPSEVGVAAALTALGAGNALYDETLTLQDAKVSASFASLTGELHGAVASGMVENAEALRRNLLTQTSAEEGTFGWASFTGNWGTAKASTQNAQLKTRQSGLLGGIGAAGNGFRSTLGVGKTTASFNAAGHADADSTLVLASAGYQGGALTATIGGTYAWHDIDTRRATSLGAITNSLTDAFKGTTGQIFGEVGFGLNAGQMQLSPFAGLSYVRVHSDAVTESGGPTALNIAEDTRTVTFGSAGVRLKMAEGWSAGDYTIAPYASAAWRHAWGDRNSAMSARFAGGSTGFGVLGPVIAKDAAEIGLGLELGTGPVRFSAGYNGLLGGGWNNHSAQMKVSIGF